MVNALKWMVTNCSQGYYLCTWVWWKISLLNYQLKWKVASVKVKLKVQPVWYTYYVWLNYICWKDSIFRKKEFEGVHFRHKNSGNDSYAPCDMRLGVRVGVWPIDLHTYTCTQIAIEVRKMLLQDFHNKRTKWSHILMISDLHPGIFFIGKWSC